MGSTGVRARTASAVAAAGALSLLLGVAALAAAPSASASQAGGAAAQANPPGNNGTIKIEGVDIQSGPPDNNPHQGCSFTVEFYNYDEGADLQAEVEFADQAPTGDGGLQVVSGDQSLFIGGDPAGGGNDLDAKETYTLKFTGQPHPQQGYHVKITVHADGSQGNDTKHKVFWVEGCGTPPTTPPTTQPTTPPTTQPTTPPTTRPTTPPPSTPPTDTPSVPPTLPPGTPTTDTPSVPPSDEPSVPQTSTSTPADGTTTDSPSPGVPTEIDAGLSGGSSDGGGSGPFGVLGGVLIAAGGVMLAAGAAVALRRRGKHSL